MEFLVDLLSSSLSVIRLIQLEFIYKDDIIVDWLGDIYDFCIIHDYVLPNCIYDIFNDLYHYNRIDDDKYSDMKYIYLMGIEEITNHPKINKKINMEKLENMTNVFIEKLRLKVRTIHGFHNDKVFEL